MPPSPLEGPAFRCFPMGPIQPPGLSVAFAKAGERIGVRFRCFCACSCQLWDSEVELGIGRGSAFFELLRFGLCPSFGANWAL
ncbi:unnamed protein product [Sphagnum jensenii]